MEQISLSNFMKIHPAVKGYIKDPSRYLQPKKLSIPKSTGHKDSKKEKIRRGLFLSTSNPFFARLPWLFKKIWNKQNNIYWASWKVSFLAQISPAVTKITCKLFERHSFFALWSLSETCFCHKILIKHFLRVERQINISYKINCLIDF